MTIILDIPSMEVDSNGVHPFVWPLDRREYAAAGTNLVRRLCTVFGEFGRETREDLPLLACLSAHVAVKCLTLFQAQTLADRLAGQDVRLPANAPTWHAAFGRGPVNDDYLPGHLKRGVLRPPTWKRFLRPLGQIRFRDGLARRPIEFSHW